MRKWLLSLIVGSVLIFGSLYIFIPNIVSLKSTTGVGATRPGLHRMLIDRKNVTKWWPGKISNDSFYLNDLVYTINNSNITVLPISVTGENANISTSLFLIPLAIDSTQLEWAGAMATSYNPVKRFYAYLKAKKIKNDMALILEKMRTFYSESKNIYGFDIKRELVVDSLLIATSGKCKGLPNNQFIYSLIDKLRNYAAKNLAKESGYPMLNVGTTDSINFDVKVAIPVDKLLSSADDILQKRMLGRGKILVTEVKGGIEIAAKALEQIQQYGNDYQRSSPAIPFYSLITDRLKETDSTKWVTRIYFPVM
jgi:hypothetical protein